jgi:hypothetical protein
LESNVDDSLWNAFSNSVKELSFSDDDLELWLKLNGVLDVAVGSVLLAEDVLLQQFDSFGGVFLSPFLKDFLFISLIELFGKLDVLESCIFECLGHELVGLGFELLDWFADSAHDGS